MKKWAPLLLFSILLVFAGCAPQNQGTAQLDYDQTKKMVVDILQTEEGKKAIQGIMKDDGIKQSLVMDQATVTSTIQQTLNSEQQTEFWKKSFKDPKFTATFAKSMQKEHEKVIKSLMNDPEYQKMMMDLLKNPEVEREMVELMRSQKYRAHLQQVMTETFESPIYQEKIQDLLMKAAAEQQMKKMGGESGGSSGGKETGGGAE